MTTSPIRYTTLFIILFTSTMFGQNGDRQYRRTGVLNGNQVRTVFGNWGVIGQPAEVGKRGAWKDDNNGYLGDVSPLVGVEVKWQDTTFHSVVTPPTARPTTRHDEDPISGKPWTWEPLGGYFAPDPNQSIAISNNKSSWPTSPGWPDKLNDPTDPGWLGSWNGYFGKRISADLETYFAMDDNNDEHYSVAANNTRGIAFKPDPTNPARNGLGLEMRVRGLQWAQFVAKDNIFWLYEVKNTGRVSYDKVSFGMIVGTYVGVTSTENAGEFDDDWSFYDVQENITYTGDFDRNTSRNARWNQKYPVGMVGYAFLESPGNPFDGIDNDGDADSSVVGRAFPQFISISFDSTRINAGSQIVLIGDDFARTLFTVPSVDSLRVKTRGMRDSIWIYPGRTKVAEGNVLADVAGNTFINPNAYDGIDNDFDGLIDENFFLHYHQIKRDPSHVPPITLIDILRPVRYANYLGGSGTNAFSMIDEKRNDGIDNDNDWSRDKRGVLKFDRDGNLRDDVGRDGVRSTNDIGERDGQPTSGYDAQGNDTNLPGEPGIDKTDVSESDQVGLSSFFYFTPAGDLSMFDDENLWRALSPGFFSVPVSIVNNRPQFGQDGDFVYGSGFFPLLAGETERFSIALVFGGGKSGGTITSDIADLLRNKRTVQKIYDANYQFPTAPEKPSGGNGEPLRAVAGDKKVTLYWDNAAELTDDPALNLNDFEGYKIYRSIDPNFSDIFTITDGNGTPQGYQPLAQFDVRDGVTGFFPATGDLFEAAQGYSIYLGNDNGLQHSFVDSGDVDNGRTYYYAVVAYDRGFDSLEIFPSENTKQISVSVTGEITHDINVAVVRPNAKVAGYVSPSNGVSLTHDKTYGTGSIVYNVLDETKVNAHTYQVEFLDTQVDGIDNNGNGLVDAADSTEWERYTTSYSVQDMSGYTEQFVSKDTNFIFLNRKNLVPFSISVLDPQGALVQPSRYIVNPLLGSIRGATPGSLPNGGNAKYSISYHYYPVYRSPRIQGSPYLTESKDSDIFDGVQPSFADDWSITKVNLDSLGWNRNPPYQFSFSPLLTQSGDVTIRGYRSPNDYEIQFASTIVDTSQEDPDLFVPAVPVNFRVFNLTDSTYVKFAFAENLPGVPGSVGKLSPGDDILLLERNPRGGLSRTWDISFTRIPTDPRDTVYQLTTGDKLTIKTTKPFRQGDVFEFTTVPPRIDDAAAKNTLDRVKVVPNPYITQSSFEPPLPPGRTAGRGTRKIDFIHLPVGASVKIFTSRGDHLITLYHDGNIEDGTVSWNLKTKENLDIAYGVYFYVVESPVGNKTGKIAIIK